LTNRALVLLSGERTTIPQAEARALFLAYDAASKFRSPSPRLLICDSDADPFLIGSRIAYARRVGVMVEGRAEAAPLLRGKRVRFRVFDLKGEGPPADPAEYLSGVEADVDLRNPQVELTLVRAGEDYLAVTSPTTMVQGWSSRSPRRRPFFHPAAIFPKLSRAMVNMTMCLPGEVFLDPFAGTGSLPLEAHLVGARVLALDRELAMVKGALANMKHFCQDWLGAVRADSALVPVASVDAIATDVPYGRASSTHGSTSSEVLGRFLPAAASVLRPGRLLVVMHQKSVKAALGEGFTTLEEHDLHVHKLLTRTITILRRR
jgi:16S rRNA G966 N2-methylase RsmD